MNIRRETRICASVVGIVVFTLLVGMMSVTADEILTAAMGGAKYYSFPNPDLTALLGQFWIPYPIQAAWELVFLLIAMSAIGGVVSGMSLGFALRSSKASSSKEEETIRRIKSCSDALYEMEATLARVGYPPHEIYEAQRFDAMIQKNTIVTHKK